MSKEYLSSHESAKLMEQAVIFGDFTLASGANAKSKFDFDLVETDSDLFRNIVSALSRCIKDSRTNFDGILTIATGATRLGNPLSKILGVPHVESRYEFDDAGNKQFTVSPDLRVSNAFLVDDVFTKGTNATKTAAAARIHGIETVGLAVVLDRSGEAQPTILGSCAVSSLIRIVLD